MCHLLLIVLFAVDFLCHLLLCHLLLILVSFTGVVSFTVVTTSMFLKLKFPLSYGISCIWSFHNRYITNKTLIARCKRMTCVKASRKTFYKVLLTSTSAWRSLRQMQNLLLQPIITGYLNSFLQSLVYSAFMLYLLHSLGLIFPKIYEIS